MSSDRAPRVGLRGGGKRHILAQKLAIAQNTVSGIVHRKSWDHVTTHPALDAVFERVPHRALEIRGEVR